jgi:arginine/lysine/ornithine decarboxylase
MKTPEIKTENGCPPKKSESLFGDKYRGDYIFKTPICDFVEDYVSKKTARFHMPGHKGKENEHFISRLNAYDITEIEGADYLYEPTGIIKQSEEIAASVYGVPYAFYSTEGSSLCIKAMLSLTCKPGEKVIALNNAHRAFADGCKLLGLTPVWIEDIKHLEAALAGYSDAAAVFLTTPDYLGNLIDIDKAAKLVKEQYGKTLLIDSAHGAYLYFTEENYAHSADLVCISAHKTLSVLTGGALLLSNDANNAEFAANAVAAMKPFASTSPSYLILQSLDYCNKILSSKEYRDRLQAVIKKTAELKLKFGIDTQEPLKICFRAEGDYRGVFSEAGIIPEILTDNLIVLMISAETSDEDFKKLEEAMNRLKISAVKKNQKPQFIYSE